MIDGFFEGLEGMWLLEGEVAGAPIVQEVIALPDRAGFIRIDYLPSERQPGDVPYEAIAIVGRAGDAYYYTLFDPHTRGSGPVGVGVPDGDSMTFTFDYPDGPLRTTFQRVPEGWDIRLDGARGPFGFQRLRQPRKRKVWAYITDADRLLLLRHLDLPMHLSGLQVPSGTLEEGESPASGVLREAGEETGRDDLEIVQSLGESRQKWGYADADVFGFHLRFTGDVPERFEHGEFANAVQHRFGFFWAHVLDADALISDNQRVFLPRLKTALGLEVT